MSIKSKVAAWHILHEDLSPLNISKPIVYNTYGLDSESHKLDFSFLLNNSGPFGILSKIDFYDNLKEIQKMAYIFHPTKYIEYFASSVINVRDDLEKILSDSYGITVLPYLYLDKQWNLYCLLDLEEKIKECELANILLTTTLFTSFKEKNQHLFKK